MISLADCQRGGIYRIKSRNLPIGVFNGVDGFIGIREKFWDYFLFTEYHHDTGPPFGTVTPLELIDEIPFRVHLQEYYPSACSECHLPVEFLPEDEIRGKWVHRKGNTFVDENEIGHYPRPGAYTYVPLFDHLALIEGIPTYKEIREMTLDQRKLLRRVDPYSQV
jgi:hypothetical protein